MVSKGDKRKLLAQISSVSFFLLVKNYSTGKQFSCTSSFLKKYFYLFGYRSKLWHEGSLVATYELSSCSVRFSSLTRDQNFQHWGGVSQPPDHQGSPPLALLSYHPALRQEPRKLKGTLQSITSESGSGDQKPVTHCMDVSAGKPESSYHLILVIQEFSKGGTVWEAIQGI